jgi:hypothetical protein
MTNEQQLGLWHVTWEPEGSPPVVRDLANNAIATIHASSDETAMVRAGLIASTPALLESVAASLEVFRAIAEHAEEPANLAAQDMIPVLESALSAASFMGPVTDDTLNGP